MKKMRSDAKISQEERRKFFLRELLKWHPDKNNGHEEEATEVFQFLQEKKDWFLGPN